MALLWIALGAGIYISPIKKKLSDVLGVSVEKKTTHTLDKSPILKKQITQWEAIIATRPDYRDGYYMLATLEYQLGNIVESKKYLDEVIKIDPNYPKIMELEKLLFSSPR